VRSPGAGTMESNGGPGRPGDAKGRKRLQELAAEASERLERVFEASAEPSREAKALVSGPRGEAGRPPAGGVPGSAGEGEEPRIAGEEAGRALVAHVSPGVAWTLANVLKSLRFRTTVVCAPEDLASDSAQRRWDIVFLQGTPMPFPGPKLIAATLLQWARTGAPLVLLRRPDEAPMPGGAGVDAADQLSWPFERKDVHRVVSRLLQGRKEPPSNA